MLCGYAHEGIGFLRVDSIVSYSKDLGIFLHFQEKDLGIFGFLCIFGASHVSHDHLPEL